MFLTVKKKKKYFQFFSALLRNNVLVSMHGMPYQVWYKLLKKTRDFFLGLKNHLILITFVVLENMYPEPVPSIERNHEGWVGGVKLDDVPTIGANRGGRLWGLSPPKNICICFSLPMVLYISIIIEILCE